MVNNLPASAGDIRDLGLIPRWGRSPGGGRGNPLRYSCLQSPMDREAWLATIHRLTQCQTQLKQQSMHAEARLYISTCILRRSKLCLDERKKLEKKEERKEN